MQSRPVTRLEKRRRIAFAHPERRRVAGNPSVRASRPGTGRQRRRRNRGVFRRRRDRFRHPLRQEEQRNGRMRDTDLIRFPARSCSERRDIRHNRNIRRGLPSTIRVRKDVPLDAPTDEKIHTAFAEAATRGSVVQRIQNGGITSKRAELGNRRRVCICFFAGSNSLRRFHARPGMVRSAG